MQNRYLLYRFRRWVPGEQRWSVKPSVPVASKKSTNKNKSKKWTSFSAMRTKRTLGYSEAVSLRHIIICRSVAWWPKWRRILGCLNSSAWAAWSPAAPALTRSAQHALITCLGCLATRRYQGKISGPPASSCKRFHGQNSRFRASEEAYWNDFYNYKEIPRNILHV